MLKYWSKITSGNQDRYWHIVYKYLKAHNNDCVVVYKNWAKEIRQILLEIGKEALWLTDMLDTDPKQFIYYARCTLVNIYILEWCRQRQNTNKLQSYLMYKTVFQQELYLINIKSPTSCRGLTSLHLSSHNLAVETGRYPPRFVRHHHFWKQCDEMDVEDEFHFLLNCIIWHMLVWQNR